MFLPPAFGVAVGRLLLRRLCSSQSAAEARTSRILTMMMRPQLHESKLHAMTAAAALSAGVGGGAFWYMSNNRPAASRRSSTCNSRCDDTYRGFMAAIDNALQRRHVDDDVDQQPLSAASESTEAACGGGVVSPPAAPTEQIGDSPPSKVDWVEAGVVSRVVRKQNKCGCCWAMAAVGSVEAAHYLKTKQHIMLSVQELIDCNWKNRGCFGGSTYEAFEYVWDNGLSAESSYPYIDQGNLVGCKEKKTPAARISGIRRVFPKTEDALERAVAKQPVVVTLQHSDELWKYAGGIMEYEPRPHAPGSGLQMHAVLMVGYGTDTNGVKYWRFKNSWGEGWGERGFGRFRRRVADERGVAGIFMYDAYYPLLD